MQYRTLFATVIALGLAIVTAKAEGQTRCFLCDDWDGPDEAQHRDVIAFANDMHGAFHPEPGGGRYSCSHALHMWYCNGCNGFAAAEWEQAARAGDGETLLRMLLETDGARLNLQRSALQVSGVGDKIFVHVPLSLKQTSQLQLALNEERRRRTLASAAASGELLPASTSAEGRDAAQVDDRKRRRDK